MLRKSLQGEARVACMLLILCDVSLLLADGLFVMTVSGCLGVIPE